jgi:hypothetical protein
MSNYKCIAIIPFLSFRVSFMALYNRSSFFPDLVFDGSSLFYGLSTQLALVREVRTELGAAYLGFFGLKLSTICCQEQIMI